MKVKNLERVWIYLIILSLLLVLNCIFMVYAQDISSEGVTTITEDFDTEFIYDEIQKVYEISDSSLGKGYSATLNEKDAFRIRIRERDYYILVWNITSDDRVMVIFPGKRQLIFGMKNLILVDINQDSKLDIELELKAIKEVYKNAKTIASVEFEDETATIKDTETIPDRKAEIYIKKFIEKKLVSEGDYFELFDVTVRLAKEEIYYSRDLSAFVIFENFGEGVSEIDIIYSIINENGAEVYRGIDSKVVQTEDRVVKDFDFLELPLGKYILRAEIFYGQNQTGESEQDFEIVKTPLFSIVSGPLFFVIIMVCSLVLVVFARKFIKSKKSSQNKKRYWEKMKKRKFLLIGTLMFLIVIFFLSILFLGDILPLTSFSTLSSDDAPLTKDAERNKKSYDITSDFGESGEIVKRLYKSDEIIYNYKEKDYKITATGIDHEKKQVTIKILVSSISKYYDIKENEILEVDLDVDGYGDISISIFELDYESVVFIIKKLNEQSAEITGGAILGNLKKISGLTRFWSGAIIVIIISLIIIIKIYRTLTRT